jgi:hypothetical protein
VIDDEWQAFLALPAWTTAATAIKQTSRSSSRVSDAERQRLCRKRRRQGIAVVPVPVGEAVFDTLVALNWLRDGDAANRAKVGEAIAAMLCDLAKNSRHM